MTVPNYSDYSFRQLYEALDSLRSDTYPEALAALEQEIGGRDDPGKTELEEVYFRLDADKNPEHASRLRALIEARGGFDTIAPEVVTDENRFRTGWRRFWAMLIFDPLIFAVGFSIITAPFGRAAADNPAIQTALNFAGDVGWIFYFVLLHATCGQTLGKMITGVKVVRNSDLGPIRLWHALARESWPLLFFIVAMLILPEIDFVDTGDAADTFAQLPPSVIALAAAPFIWGLLEILTMLFNKRRRALHDILAKTVVVRHVRRSAKKQQGSGPADISARGVDFSSTIVGEPERYRTGWRRLGALFVDGLIMALLFGPIAGLLGRQFAESLAFRTGWEFFQELFWVMYFVMMHTIFGQTLGKMVTEVRVVRNKDLGSIRLWHALARQSVPLLFFVAGLLYLPYYEYGHIGPGQANPQFSPVLLGLAIAAAVWSILELLTMLLNKRRRALHDFIAGTVVVRYER